MLLQSVQVEPLEECCLNFSKLKLLPDIAQVQKARDRFSPFLVFFKSHVCVSVYFKFIQSRIVKFLKASQWVHKKKMSVF